ncbi:hypothetical protein MJ575_02270 [Klebsiella pneumoniae]|nr:hypothetical protein MJ575_02270 [Klebsiella pneumoniae]
MLWNRLRSPGSPRSHRRSLSTTCAYAFARMRFPGESDPAGKVMPIFQMFPAVLLLVAL